MQFVLARSTAEAEDLLRSRSFDAIISDLGRPGDRRAGFTLLARARISHPTAPYFIYCGSRAPELVREAQTRGAQGLTDDPAELISMVVTALR
jgi:DNA-binding NarL/FixJ family response regulator